MEQQITFRALIEVIGKPQEHVEKALQGYIEKLEQDSKFKILNKEVTPAKKQEKEEFWATFAELEVQTDKLENLGQFCFEYMPSLIEILEPKELPFTDVETSAFLNDLQTRLHQVDMVAKQLKLENDHLKRNSAFMLKNVIRILLGKKTLTLSQLCQLTGVAKEDDLADFLDKLIDKGEIDLKEGNYSLKETNGSQ
ncbi:hypothetical protein COV20_05170 [Candidatus Woesearchaeota archaeon CG10_big_fil_rev_8_21_14_0_10_45_16]|nr:MAG: hypothetical protein COV20_05170 [Candidatus Woesearchaeota archaeon CG10_big_fil_rev_8_21_14_0_10_45_16]